MTTIHATPRLPDLRRDLLPDLQDAGARSVGLRRPGTSWDDPVQRVADATVWLLFRLSGVRS